MEFRVLGPLEVRTNGTPVALGGPRQRALLAILLLRANQVVSRDLLIEELWGPGATATTGHALHVTVARLRKALDADAPRLVSQAPGYVLRVEPGELDLDRFEALVSEGRDAAAAGDLPRAAERLSAAEALWRGRPLADLEFERFARLDVERLDERRLCVVEDRLAAELGLGRHEALVAELDALVAEHPLRDRLREQLMLALYRSGRQAEALAAYRSGRELLVEQQGLDPSPRLQRLQRSILEHDEALQLSPAVSATAVAERDVGSPAEPAPAVRPAPGDRRPHHRALLGGLAVAGLATLAVVALAGGGDQRDAPLGGNAIAVLSPAGQLDSVATLRAAPTRMAAGFGSLWVTHADTGHVTRVEPGDGTVREANIRVGGGPTGIATGAGSVWVADGVGGTVSRIDPATEEVVQRIGVATRPADVTVAAGSVWIADAQAGSVMRLDPRTGRQTREIDIGTTPSAMTSGGGSLWVTSGTGRSVTRIDLRTSTVQTTIAVGGGPSAVAYGAGAAWVANSLDGTVSRIDPGNDTVTATLGVGNGPAAVSVTGSTVWVANEFGGSLSQIDARRVHVVDTQRAGAEPAALATAPGRAWVATRERGPSHRGGRLTVLTPNESFDSIDPATEHTVTPAALLGMTNDGLVAFKHSGGGDGTQLVPDLAVTLPSPTDAGRRYTFRLRPGVRYSTGRPVLARDVRHSLERVFRLRSVGVEFFDAIVGAGRCRARPGRCDLSRGVIADDRRRLVTFRLRQPDPELLYKLALSYAYVVPADTPPGPPGTRALPATGPYRISSYRPGRDLRLVRNPRFREWSRAARPDGYADEIVYRLGVKPDAAATAVLRGRADLAMLAPGQFSLSELSAQRQLDIQTHRRRHLRSHDLLGTEYLVLNVRKPPFADVRARRALNLAVDRGVLGRLMLGALATPACQPLPPQMPGFRRRCPYTSRPDRTGRWHGPDLARARRLVTASGTMGDEVVLINPAEPPVAITLGRALARMLRQIGYRPRVRYAHERDFDRLASSQPQGTSDIAPAGWGADYPSASTFLKLHLGCSSRRPDSPDDPNISGFCSPRLDRMMRRALALQITSPSKANALWARSTGRSPTWPSGYRSSRRDAASSSRPVSATNASTPSGVRSSISSGCGEAARQTALVTPGFEPARGSHPLRH